MENPLVVSAGAGEVLPAMLDQMADGHYTFTDTELHEILGVVINNTNSSNPDDLVGGFNRVDLLQTPGGIKADVNSTTPVRHQFAHLAQNGGLNFGNVQSLQFQPRQQQPVDEVDVNGGTMDTFNEYNTISGFTHQEALAAQQHGGLNNNNNVIHMTMGSDAGLGLLAQRSNSATNANKKGGKKSERSTSGRKATAAVPSAAAAEQAARNNKGGAGGGSVVGDHGKSGNNSAAAALGAKIEMDDTDMRVSHGASEKQRRDRINAMIDELRTIVPSSIPAKQTTSPTAAAAAAAAADNTDQANSESARRSKFVVLQDTINLLRVLQLKMAASETELAELRGVVQKTQSHAAAAAGPELGAPKAHDNNTSGSGEELNLNIGYDGAADDDMNDGIVGGHHHNDNPDSQEELQNHTFNDVTVDSAFKKGGGGAAGGAAVAMNVSEGSGSEASGAPRMSVAVDMGKTSCYIKVGAPDRRGLLADILQALTGLPMEVQRAAVTTNNEGGTCWVTDIFEMKKDPEVRITGEEVRCHLEKALSEAYLSYHHPKDAGPKKRRKGAGSSDGTGGHGSNNSDNTSSGISAGSQDS